LAIARPQVAASTPADLTPKEFIRFDAMGFKRVLPEKRWNYLPVPIVIYDLIIRFQLSCPDEYFHVCFLTVLRADTFLPILNNLQSRELSL